MRRRTFIAGVAATAAPMLWPLVARAQQTKVPVIGFLLTTRERSGTVSAAFRSGLKDAGYVEGQNVEFRFGDDRHGVDLLPALELQAREFVDLKVAAIVVLGGVDGLNAAAAATSRIPIVYAGGADPVKLGLAASLNRPGGNITGITIILNYLVDKRLDLLLKLKPEVATVGYLIGDRVNGEVDQLMASARILKRQVIVVECHDRGELQSAFATMVEQGAGAVIVGAFPTAFNNRKEVIALAAEHRLPAIYAQRPYVYEGGLMSYFPADPNRQLAIQYVARILKGEKPGDLPIQQPTEYEFITNLRTAKALGITIPYELQTLADKTIE
jgi:putative ABC transport system substrate-binding protein